ncbi:MAG: class I SAM-dependent methyltransferase [Cyanobacteria bacterium P01_F01_bin.56]
MAAWLLETDSAKVTANELNSDRAADRWAQGDIVTQFDATEYQPDQQYDVVIANPPFGAMRDEQGQCRRFALPDNRRGPTQIDQAMAFHALKAIALKWPLSHSGTQATSGQSAKAAVKPIALISSTANRNSRS